MQQDAPASDGLELAIASRFEALPDLVRSGSALASRGRFLTADFAIGIGSATLVVSVVAGAVTAVARGPFLLRPWSFAIRAEAEGWRQFLEPYPRPGWNDIMAMTKRGAARIEGDLQPLMANLQFIKDVLASPRSASDAASQPSEAK